MVRGKIKRVGHRSPSSQIDEQTVVSEYLNFRNLSLLTSFRFGGRLLKAEYPYSPEDEGFETFALRSERADSRTSRVSVP